MNFIIIVFIIFTSNLSLSQDKSSEITCEPFRENRKIIGFTCPNFDQESLLSKMGIKASDVIVEYNEIPIVSFKQMQKFYEQLHKKGKTVVKFKRDNNLFTVENANKM